MSRLSQKVCCVFIQFLLKEVLLENSVFVTAGRWGSRVYSTVTGIRHLLGVVTLSERLLPTCPFKGVTLPDSASGSFDFCFRVEF